MKTKSEYPSEVIEAAYDAVDQNDGSHWEILRDAKPPEMEMADFIDFLLA